MADLTLSTAQISTPGAFSAENGNIKTDGTGVGTLTANTLTATVGGLHSNNGGLSVNLGTTGLYGSVLLLNVTPSASIQAPTGAGVTITTNRVINRTAPTGAVTGAILAAGASDGQIIVVTNESTTVVNTITFSTTLATGLVLTDASSDAIVIKAASAAIFVWFASLNSGNGAWVHVGPFAG